jgi:hypothetical protein
MNYPPIESDSRVFIAKGTNDVWCEQVIDADDLLTDLIDGRKSVEASDFSLIEDPDAHLVLEEEVEGAVRYVKLGGSSNRFIPVLVVWSAGSDGTSSTVATWTYNIYRLADTGHATALTAAAVQPENSPARIFKGPVTKATNDTVGEAYIAADGTWKLYSCCEKHGSAAKVCP